MGKFLEEMDQLENFKIKEESVNMLSVIERKVDDPVVKQIKEMKHELVKIYIEKKTRGGDLKDKSVRIGMASMINSYMDALVETGQLSANEVFPYRMKLQNFIMYV